MSKRSLNTFTLMDDAVAIRLDAKKLYCSEYTANNFYTCIVNEQSLSDKDCA